MTFFIYIVLVIGLFVTALNLLPTAASVSPDVTNSLITIFGYLRWANWILPITHLFYCALIVFTYDGIVWSWHVTVKVIRFFRGHSDGA